MFKKLLCLVFVAITIVTTGIVGAGAATADVAETAINLKTLIMGDIDLDGEISVMDATALQRGLAGVIELTEDQWYVAHTTGFENVYVGDATEIQRYLAGYKCNGCTGLVVEVPDDDNSGDELSLDAIEKAVEKRFMEYVNEERKAVGVQYLDTNEILMKASKVRGDELLVDFSHTRPDGSSCFTAIEDQDIFGWMGENVAYNGGMVNFSDPAKVEQQIDALAYQFYKQFKNSPGHYENMIKGVYNCHGVGVTIVESDVYGYECYCAHMFGQVW